MKPLNTRFLIILTTLAFLGLCVSVPAFAGKEKDCDPPNPHPSCGNDGGDDKVSRVFLEVDFRDKSCDSNDGDKFCSDNDTPYKHDVDSVSASIDKFRLGLNVGMNGTRNFFLDLRDCIQEPCESPLENDYGVTIGWNVFAFHPDGAQYLEMSVSDDPKPVNFHFDFFDDQDQNWRIMFNPGECPMDASGVNLADMATVTKTTDGWVFEAEADDVACLQLRMGGRKHYTFHGLYHLPFAFTATALP
jgi:hypothetical protein